MIVACFDLEGVFLPEIWLEVSRLTGIEELSLTTRECPDYSALMKRRMKLLKEHDITIDSFREVVAKIEPLRGAKSFLDWARRQCQVLIISDTFYEFASPLMAKLGQPVLFCHHLVISKSGHIEDFQLRQDKPKVRAVQAFQSLNFKTFACGDSFNDVGMITTADHGCFFRAPPKVLEQYPKVPCLRHFKDLKRELQEFIHQCEPPRSVKK